jgi:uncharacterized lipoprotein YbaY
MRKLHAWISLSCSALCLTVLPARGEESAEWQGSVADDALMATVPPLVQKDADLQMLWKSWGQKEAVPTVDFSRDILVLVVSKGSKIMAISTKLDEAGDLKAVAGSTRDLRPGFRFRMQAVRREGVKSVNGKVLAAMPTLSGKVLFKGDAPIPEGAVVTVKLNDVALADAPSITLATFATKEARAFPVAYDLSFDLASIKHKVPHMTSLGVRIEMDGKLLFISDTSTPVFNEKGELLKSVDVSVIAVK